jgi:methionyl aminopeptidase
MILNEEQTEQAILAGKIASKALLLGRGMIHPGVKMVEVLDKVEEFIIKEGASIAFPAQIALNEIAAHYCPLADDEYVFKNSDIIKLDLGVHVDGIIADNALTVIFKENPEYEKNILLKKASDDALRNAIKTITTGITLGEIGLIIQESIAKYDLSPIKNLSGHGLGKYSVHESPTVPNYHSEDKTELEYNQIIAIEPFSTNGHGVIYESANPTLFSIDKIKPVRSMYAREILNELKVYHGLPFTTRWLTRKFTPAKVKLGLAELRNAGMIHQYPPLIEVKKGLVSQSEHTVIVRDKPIITTEREE